MSRTAFPRESILQVSGILVRLPVPGQLDGVELTGLVAPGKDVDGLTPISAGRLLQGTPGLRPCTPLGVIELLDSYGVTLEGAEAVVVGRSNLVGKPVSMLLQQRNATVVAKTRMRLVTLTGWDLRRMRHQLGPVMDKLEAAIEQRRNPVAET